MPRPKSFEPEEALAQMMRIFWDKGYEATTVADLEAATDLNKRSLYNTFGNKEAIFDAALKHYMQGMGEMGTMLMREPLGIHNIKAFFSAMRYEPNDRGCLLTKTLNARNAVPEQSFECAKTNILQFEAMMHKNLVTAFGRKAKARRLAAFLSSTLQGITTMASVDPDPRRLSDVVATVFAVLDAEESS